MQFYCPTLALIISVFASQVGFSQNLLTNGDFENFSSLPNNVGQWYKCTGWSNVNGVTLAFPYATPDYLHTSGSGSVALPNSIFATVFPHSGNAIMGFITKYLVSANFREYMSTQFTTPMVAGQNYNVSFWLTNGNPNYYGGYSSNRIGVRFSESPLTQVNHEPIGVIPQLEIAGQVWSTTWQQFTFSYTADSAYNFITIGNFYDDASTAAIQQVVSIPGFTAYYFIDKVEITPGGSVPLPVEILTFEGKNIDEKNIITWSTASELNNDYFELEKKSADDGFQPIVRVNGQGNSNIIQNYSAEDYDIISGNIYYYRLKQVDIDGKYKYTGTISLKTQGRNKIYYYLNSDDAFIGCMTDKLQNIKIELFNIRGEKITTLFNGYAKENNFVLKINPSISKDFFVVLATFENEYQSLKISR